MTQTFGAYQLVHGDAIEWLGKASANTIHAIVTDPPYGLVEYSPIELTKQRNNSGGIWRLPYVYDGYQRRPLPRFTVLRHKDHQRIYLFFNELARQLVRVLVPGAHVFISTNQLVSHWIVLGFVENGFEKRGEIVRIVQTLKGGDRPKNAHVEFSDVSVVPRSSWEPWLLFRKPLEGRVQDNLRKWGTGALRRLPDGRPFKDLIVSAPAGRAERQIANHPSLKPQDFMRQLSWASLPLGRGVILDPFAGSGSTIAAAASLGLTSIGIERDRHYYEMAVAAVPRLVRLRLRGFTIERSEKHGEPTVRTRAETVKEQEQTTPMIETGQLRSRG